MSHRIAKENRRSLKRRGIDWRAAPRPPSRVKRPFRRALAMQEKIGAAIKEHGKDFAALQAALSVLGPYESRGKGKGRSKPERNYMRTAWSGLRQEENPMSRECARRARQIATGMLTRENGVVFDRDHAVVPRRRAALGRRSG